MIEVNKEFYDRLRGDINDFDIFVQEKYEHALKWLLDCLEEEKRINSLPISQKYKNIGLTNEILKEQYLKDILLYINYLNEK